MNKKIYILMIVLFSVLIAINIVKIIDLNTASTVRKSYLLVNEKNVKLWEREFDCKAEYLRLSIYKKGTFTGLNLQDYIIDPYFKNKCKAVSLEILDINDEYEFYVTNVIEEDKNYVSICYYSCGNTDTFKYTIGDEEIDPNLEQFLSEKGFDSFNTYLKQIEENRKDFDNKLAKLTKIKTKIYLVYIVLNVILLAVFIGINIIIRRYWIENNDVLDNDEF